MLRLDFWVKVGVVRVWFLVCGLVLGKVYDYFVFVFFYFESGVIMEF